MSVKIALWIIFPNFLDVVIVRAVHLVEQQQVLAASNALVAILEKHRLDLM